MLPPFYQASFQAQLSATQNLMLQMLVMVLQKERQVTIERLAGLFAQPIQFESRRGSIQRFLVLPQFSIRGLWFPVLKYWLKLHFKQTKRLKLGIDRTQWQERNLFVVSLLWDKRAIPIYWQVLPKQGFGASAQPSGSSNLAEQKALLRPVFRLLKHYKLILTADREFHSVKLANWLVHQRVPFGLPSPRAQAERSSGVRRAHPSRRKLFALRQKKGTYIQQHGQEFQRLETLGLKPGISRYLTSVQVTKQQGFGKFDLAAYWQRHYRGKTTDEPWYILTNLSSLETAVSDFKARFGIEAMFKVARAVGIT